MSPVRSQPPPATKKQRGGGTPPASRGTSSLSGASRDFSIDADDAIARRRAELRRLQQLRNNPISTSTIAIGSISIGTSRTTPSLSSVTNTDDLLVTARTERKDSGGPPIVATPSDPSAAGHPPSMGNSSLSAKPPPPSSSLTTPKSVERVRHSDLFPTVPKSKALSTPSQVQSKKHRMLLPDDWIQVFRAMLRGPRVLLHPGPLFQPDLRL
jgi:hypothetical protein